MEMINQLCPGCRPYLLSRSNHPLHIQKKSNAWKEILWNWEQDCNLSLELLFFFHQKFQNRKAWNRKMYSVETATISISVVEHCSTRKSISTVTGHCEIPFTNSVGAGKIAQWLKCLMHKYKAPTSDLQHYVKATCSSACLKSKHRGCKQVDSWSLVANSLANG